MCSRKIDSLIYSELHMQGMAIVDWIQQLYKGKSCENRNLRNFCMQTRVRACRNGVSDWREMLRSFTNPLIGTYARGDAYTHIFMHPYALHMS